jgi:hypothetical protein
MRWMDAGHPQTQAVVRTWRAERPRNDYGDVLGIEVVGTLIGLVRLHGAEPETGCAELDVHLGEKDHWGQGPRHRRGPHGLPVRLRADAPAQDLADGRRGARSRPARLPARGLRRGGPAAAGIRRDGRWLDKITMGLLADELG